MKVKSLLYTLLVIFFVLTNNSFAKILPPGTGTQADVPSNLLILLDKSGSMGWRMQSAAALQYPQQTVVDSSGNVYIMQYYTRGVRKTLYADGKPDTTWGNKGVTGTSGTCKMYYPYGADVHNGIMYISSLYNDNIVKIRQSDGKCIGKISFAKRTYPRAVEVVNGRIYVTTNKGLYSVMDKVIRAGSRIAITISEKI